MYSSWLGIKGFIRLKTDRMVVGINLKLPYALNSRVSIFLSSLQTILRRLLIRLFSKLLRGMRKLVLGFPIVRGVNQFKQFQLRMMTVMLCH